MGLFTWVSGLYEDVTARYLAPCPTDPGTPPTNKRDVLDLVTCSECEHFVTTDQLWRRKRRGRVVVSDRCKDCCRHRKS